MKYLALLTPVAGKTPADFGPHMIAEVKSVWDGYASGSLREIYFSPTPLVITLIYELPDIAAVHSALDGLPMIEAGLLERNVVQLGPFLQFHTLFDKSLMDAAQA
ncbi:MAG: hypothetical protein ABSC06_26175 [Rhodopila sp.]|jgi:hypothetical protein